MDLYDLGEIPQPLVRWALAQTPMTQDFRAKSLDAIASAVYLGIVKKFQAPSDCDVNVIHFEGDPSSLEWKVKGAKPFQAFVGLKGRLEEYDAYYFGVYPKEVLKADRVSALTLPGGTSGLDKVRGLDKTPGALARKLVAFEKVFPRIYKRTKGVDISEVVIGDVWDHMVDLGDVEIDPSLFDPND